MAVWNYIAMTDYEYHSREDDSRTIAFWIIAGSVLASIVLKSFCFLIFGMMATYFILRAKHNDEKGFPVYMPGKHTRHFFDSADRLSRNKYGTGYRRRIKSSRYY